MDGGVILVFASMSFSRACYSKGREGGGAIFEGFGDGGMRGDSEVSRVTRDSSV